MEYSYCAFCAGIPALRENGFQAYARKGGCGRIIFFVSYRITHVIANQSADWCGNPPVLSDATEERTGAGAPPLVSKGSLCASPVVPGTTGGLPRQCEHWLAMTCDFCLTQRKRKQAPLGFPRGADGYSIAYRTKTISGVMSFRLFAPHMVMASDSSPPILSM